MQPSDLTLRRQLVAEQDAAYAAALAADRAAEREAKAAADRAECERRAAQQCAEQRSAWLRAQWLDAESLHGAAPADAATHQLRLVGAHGQLRLAFRPDAQCAALYALAEDKLGCQKFRLRLHALPDPDPSQPIGTLPNRAVVRLEPCT